MKIKFVALIVVICLIFTGCIKVEISLPGEDKSETDATQEIKEAEVVVLDYPDAIGTDEDKLLMPFLPDEIFNTTAEENGLEGTLYKIYGTVEKITAGDDGVMDTIHLRTPDGNVVITNLALSMEADSSFSELGEVDWDMVERLCPMPKVGELCRIFAEYQGFSETEQAPFFMYGSSDYLSEVLVATIEID